jgi:DNA-binding response OmpR family regulator
MTADTVPNRPALRLLIVEDNADAAESLGMLLKLDGHAVRITLDGATALQAAESDSPDVVLLDLGLPGMDGYEVARRLRQLKTSKRPLLIAVTGRRRKDERVHSYEVGIDLHLTKPVRIEELRGFLDRFYSADRQRAVP